MVCRMNGTQGMVQTKLTMVIYSVTWIKILKIFRVFALKSILLNKLNINWSIL